MFTAALFTKAKTGKQPKCPLPDEWIKKMWYTHTMEYHSAITKDGITSFAATRMDLDLEISILSEISQRHIYHIACMWNLKKKRYRVLGAGALG